MAAFRILNQFPVYLDTEGRPASGGYLAFYESGTTTPKDVYGDPDLSTNNGSTVALLSDGRTEHDIWGDGAYRVRLYAADDTLIDEADDVEVAGGDATSIPDLVAGQFLTNNGALLLWAAIREVPDPTGQSGKILGTDGTNLNWQSPPAEPDIPDPDIVVGDGTFQAGTTGSATKFYVQTGSGSAPASGSRNTSTSVSFPTAFTELWWVGVTQNHNGVTADSHVPAETVTTRSATGFTVRFSTDENSESSVWNIINTVPFDWIAVGTITVSA